MGLISSTSIMMNMPYVEDAIKLYKNIENNNLVLGVHLNLTVGKPLLKGGCSLVDENGDKSSIEIMTHVGYIDDDTKSRTSYIGREKEFEELKDLKQIGFYDTINLINYRQLRKLTK